MAGCFLIRRNIWKPISRQQVEVNVCLFLVNRCLSLLSFLNLLVVLVPHRLLYEVHDSTGLPRVLHTRTLKKLFWSSRLNVWRHSPNCHTCVVKQLTEGHIGETSDPSGFNVAKDGKSPVTALPIHSPRHLSGTMISPYNSTRRRMAV
jgi:hypothetical protein